ncbi:aminoacyl-tRNA hydrolase [Candidatus Gracilibacteria bacterium]|nr:aminoacyl-tRNA hydrolase [Candidatus Gracilibacteria bacterium]
MKVIVGLGNPGKEYEQTRHNAGFMTVEKFSQQEGFDTFKKKTEFNAMVSEGTIGSEKVLLVLPLTFMNLSGQSIQKIAHFYKCAPQDIIAIYDDLDLPLGTIRIRSSGSAGTHNGMKSMIQELGTEDFIRIRIGIESRGESAPAQQETTDFVLGRFSKEEKKRFDTASERVLDSLKVILEKGIGEAMTQFN